MADAIRILIIDDDEVDRTMVRRSIKAGGILAETAEASDGNAGLKLLQAQPFDCAFLDYRLPDGDGLELLRAARMAGVRTPVIMLTGHGDERLAAAMIRAGGNDYLPKDNVTPENIAHSLQYVVRLHKSELDREAAEQELQVSNRRIVDILESIRDAFFAITNDWKLIYINNEAERLLQVRRDDVLNHNVLQNFPHLPAWFREKVLDTLVQRRPLSATGYDQRCGLWLEIHSYPSNDGASVYFRDISERKRSEDELRSHYEEVKKLNAQLQDAHNQLLQSEKMASIGQLAAGVAHEINSPIGYVGSNLGALESYMLTLLSAVEQYKELEGTIVDDGSRASLRAIREQLNIDALKDDLGALLTESREGLTRVKTIVQSLKDFSHMDAMEEWQFFCLHMGIDSTLNIVNNEIKYKATVIKQYADLPEVECLPAQLNQVFMNMLLNAAQAIEGRGTITVRSGAQDSQVWVEIEDTGQGIAPENMKRIFDPFFTTKPVGKGTGLGLSLSYGIIQKHHGRIEVRSEVGKGTTFRVWLPQRQPK